MEYVLLLVLGIVIMAFVQFKYNEGIFFIIIYKFKDMEELRRLD